MVASILPSPLFLSTPSARRATTVPSSETTSVEDFYPRPPRGGRRLLWCFLCNFAKFLSTPSARRATSLSFASSNVSFDFYPRPPRGGRRGRSRQLHDGADFYPRPPRGGRPGYPAQALWPCRDFYPRPPRGGRRGCFFSWRRCPTISIHALREEGDQVCHAGRSKQHNFYPRPPRGGRPGSLLRRYKHEYFYPRPPRGGRPASSAFWVAVEEFLSTPSARRATKNPLMVI